MDDLATVSQLASGLTLTSFLVVVVWAFATGKVPTKGELKRLEDSERRAWEQANESRKELAANNQVMERMTDSIGLLRQTVETFTRARAGGGDD